MPFKHFATLVIWDYALPDGWELNDEHSNWPTDPVIDGLPYRLESKRYNDAVYALDIEAFKKTNQMTDKAKVAAVSEFTFKVGDKVLMKHGIGKDEVFEVMSIGKFWSGRDSLTLSGRGGVAVDVSQVEPYIPAKFKVGDAVKEPHFGLSGTIEVATLINGVWIYSGRFGGLWNTYAESQAEEVTLTEPEIDWLARHQFKDEDGYAFYTQGLITGFCPESLDNELAHYDFRDPRPDLYVFHGERDTPANHAAIEQRRAELGL